jgi:hypothetical protein
MHIHNIQGLTTAQIRSEVSQGGKFVFFRYTISIVIVTYQRTSDIYYIQPGASTISHSWVFLLINLFLGWWGFLWGPIYTIGGIYNNLSGGTDVTAKIMSEMNQSDIAFGTGTNFNIRWDDGSISGSRLTHQYTDHNILGYHDIKPTEGNTNGYGYNVPNPNSTPPPANPT